MASTVAPHEIIVVVFAGISMVNHIYLGTESVLDLRTLKKLDVNGNRQRVARDGIFWEVEHLFVQAFFLTAGLVAMQFPTRETRTFSSWVVLILALSLEAYIMGNSIRGRLLRRELVHTIRENP